MSSVHPFIKKENLQFNITLSIALKILIHSQEHVAILRRRQRHINKYKDGYSSINILL